MNGPYNFRSDTVQTDTGTLRPMIRLLLSALLLGAAFAVPAHANIVPGSAMNVVEVQQGLIGERAAMNAARRAYPGAQAINARLVNGSRPYYVVRMRDGGDLFDVRVDARTGRVM